MICVSLTATTTAQALEQMAAAYGQADLVELRLDYLTDPQLGRLLSARRGPIIITSRPKRERGKYQGEESSRVATLKRAKELGADYVDVELDSAAQLAGSPGPGKLIVSYHNFTKTPPDLRTIHGRLCAAGADVAKVAVMARDITDNVRVLELLKQTKFPTIALCMGELGIVSRLLAPKFGAFLTFASLDKGRESAPGQIPIQDMLHLYGLRRVNAETKLYGVIANPVAHSISPALHNAAFQALGLNCLYLPFKVENIQRFVTEFKKLDIQGYSVTIPHKESIIPLLDEVDEVSRRIGAVNTVVNRGGRLMGYNTDWTAAVSGLEKALGGASLAGRRTVIVGAGGAGRAIAFGLREKGALITVVNRTPDRAQRLAADVGCAWEPLENLPRLDAEILVNSTSVGMHPKVDETAVDKTLLRPGMVVFDAVYNPLETRLLREARESGCRTVTGFDMFVLQAAAQFELWTGQTAPMDLMANILRQRLQG